MCVVTDWLGFLLAGVKHPDVVCDSCAQQGIAGVRWMCTKCKDFDLCTPCYMSGKHDLNHSFTRFITANSKVMLELMYSFSYRYIGTQREVSLTLRDVSCGVQ